MHIPQPFTIWLLIIHTSCAAGTVLTVTNSSNIRSPVSLLPTRPRGNRYDNHRALAGHSIGTYRNQPVPLAGEVSNVLCPTDKCICRASEDNRYNINCQQLKDIPRFSKTGMSYYEITFRSLSAITTIPMNAFSNLKVERINLLTNKLSRIESGAFAGIGTYLKELFIQGNGLIPVPYQKMTNLVQLRSLHLIGFKQSFIEKDNYFSYFPNLVMLHMENIVDLSSIDSQAFINKLGKLTYLRFKDVGFKQLPARPLSSLKQLKSLLIQDTDITIIYDGSFSELVNLRELDLSDNKINTIQKNAFEDISQHLTSLILLSNKLTQASLMSISSKPWNNLQTLTLSSNSQLGDLPEGIFQNMPQLQYLNLVETNLKSISSTMFMGLDDLHLLDLSWNRIEVIGDEPFKHMSKLKHLKLDNQFNNGFSTNPSPGSLTRLSLKAFHGIEKSLKILELDKTPLLADQFWKLIPGLTELTELYAPQTKVSYIPEYIFEKNTKLEILQFERNNVTIYPSSFRGLEKSLQKIFLDNNGLQTISDCTFKGLTALNVLYLYGNPLHCDCNLTWLKLFIEANKNTYDKNNYICTSPANFTDKPFYSVYLDELDCSDYTPTNCELTKTTTTGTSSSTETTGSGMTANPSVTVSFTLAGITSSTITVAWSVPDKQQITGYSFEYFPTASKVSNVKLPIHRNKYTFTVRDLQSATFYTVCITPEINNKLHSIAKICRTEQTKVETNGHGGQTGTKPDSSDGQELSRNTILGIGLASAAAFILILIGVCMVVKYKMQKLKLIEWSLGRQLATNQAGASCEDGLDNIKFGTIPNEYMEIDSTRLIRKQKGKISKEKELEADPVYSHKNKYSSCKKVHKKRVNPYENDDDSGEDGPALNDKTDNKAELEIRHSAPSRLEAKELLSYNPRLSRPLPVPPIKSNQSKTLDRRSTCHTPAKDTNKARIFVTQASVYDDKNGHGPSVYYEKSTKETIIESEREDEITNKID